MRATTVVLAWTVAAAAFLVVLSAVGIGWPGLSNGVPFMLPLVLATSLVDMLILRDPSRVALRRIALACGGLASGVLLLPDLRIVISQWGDQTLPGTLALSVVELNVWDLNPDPARTIAWLRQTRADVIVLAEARELFVAGLVRAFPDYPTQVTCSERSYCGVVILSRLPGRLLPGGSWVAGGLRQSYSPNKGFALAAVELSATDSSGSIRPIPIVAVHVDRNGLSGVSDGQVNSLVNAVKSSGAGSAGNLLLAGDFNASPWSPQLRRLDSAIAVRRVSAFAPTWPSNLGIFGLAAPPVLAPDNIYAGCRWHARNLHVGPDAGSDHRPLMAALALTPDGTKECLAASEAESASQAALWFGRGYY